MKGSYKLQALSFKQTPFCFIEMKTTSSQLFFKPSNNSNLELRAYSLKLGTIS